MNFSLNPHQEEYIARQTKEGPFSNASEVVRDALRLHEEYHLKLAALRRDIQEGFDSMKGGKRGNAGPAEIKRRVMERRAKRKK